MGKRSHYDIKAGICAEKGQRVTQFPPMTTHRPKKVKGYALQIKPPTMLAATSPEWAVKSHGCNTKSLRRVRGFRVVPVERAIKTIFGYDLNLFD